MTSSDPVVRRAAAKALVRAGADKPLVRHIRHADPVVRVGAVESLQAHGDPDDFDVLAENDSDKDRWVRKAKFQTLEVNPEEW